MNLISVASDCNFGIFFAKWRGLKNCCDKASRGCGCLRDADDKNVKDLIGKDQVGGLAGEETEAVLITNRNKKSTVKLKIG